MIMFDGEIKVISIGILGQSLEILENSKVERDDVKW